MQKMIRFVFGCCGIGTSAVAGFSFSLLTVVYGADSDLVVSPGWMSMNPGGGGQIQDIVCDESVDGRLYLCSDMEGLYRSDDRGLSWEFIADGLFDSAVLSVAVSSSDSNGLVAATGCGIFISSDGGVSWNFIEGEDAVKALQGYPVTEGGVPLFFSFFEEDNWYHNNSSWPFVDTFFIQALEKADGLYQINLISSVLGQMDPLEVC